MAPMRRHAVARRPAAPKRRSTCSAAKAGTQNGRLWIAADGSVRQTAFHVEDAQSGIRTRVEATYRHVPSLGLLMPAEMRESYTNIPGDRLRSIEGRATYQNFRVFRVSTSEGGVELR